MKQEENFNYKSGYVDGLKEGYKMAMSIVERNHKTFMSTLPSQIYNEIPHYLISQYMSIISALNDYFS